MSVIMRNICGGGSSSSSKGFPPGDVTDVIFKMNAESMLIKFSDPDDTIENSVTLSAWNSTILVRNEDHYPTSIKDGDMILTNNVKDKYKDEYFVDSSVKDNTTYYYRFYTLSTDKVYNDSTSMTYKITYMKCDSILKNNDWDTISRVSETGLAKYIWNIGDEIDIDLSYYETYMGTHKYYIYTQTITLQIWDFDHFDKSDGSGKAGILFGMKGLLNNGEESFNMLGSASNYGAWKNSYARDGMNLILTKCLKDNELKNNIKEIYLHTNAGGGTAWPTDDSVESLDKIFIPSVPELDSNNPFSGGSESIFQKPFPIFTNDNSRRKCNSDGNDVKYLTRSPAYNYNDRYYIVDENGKCGIYREASFMYALCFCFNV